MSALGPGAFGAGGESGGGLGISPVYQERMCTDITSLTRQYQKLRQRQRQAHVIIAAASAKQQQKTQMAALVPKIQSPTAMNHLFVGKKRHSHSSKNRVVTEGPYIGATRRQQGVRRGSSLDPRATPPFPDLRATPTSPGGRGPRQSRSGSASSVGEVPAAARVGVHVLGGVPATEPTPFSRTPEGAASDSASAGDAECSGDAEAPSPAEAPSLRDASKAEAAVAEGAAQSESGEVGLAEGDLPLDAAKVEGRRCEAERSESPESLVTKERLSPDKESPSLSSEEIPESPGDSNVGIPHIGEQLAGVDAPDHGEASPERSSDPAESTSGLVSVELHPCDTLEKGDTDSFTRSPSGDGKLSGDLGDGTASDVEVVCCSHDSSIQGNATQECLDSNVGSHNMDVSGDSRLTDPSMERSEIRNTGVLASGVHEGNSSQEIAIECASESVVACSPAKPSVEDKLSDHLGSSPALPQPCIPKNEEVTSVACIREIVVSEKICVTMTSTKSNMGVLYDENSSKAEVASSSKDELECGMRDPDGEIGLTSADQSVELPSCGSTLEQQDSSATVAASVAGSKEEESENVDAAVTSVTCGSDQEANFLPSEVPSPSSSVVEVTSDASAVPVTKDVPQSGGTAGGSPTQSAGDASPTRTTPLAPTPQPPAVTASEERSSATDSSQISEAPARTGRSVSECSGSEASMEDEVLTSHSGDQQGRAAPSPSIPVPGNSQHLNGCLVKNGSVTSPGKPRPERHVSFSEPDTDSDWTPSDSAIRSQTSRSRLGGSSTSPTSLQESTQYVAKFVYVTSKQSSQRPAAQRSLSSALSTSPLSPTSPSARPFNPFPMRHINTNRAKTGVKLGLYSASTLDQLGRGLRKSRGKEKL